MENFYLPVSHTAVGETQEHASQPLGQSTSKPSTYPLLSPGLPDVSFAGGRGQTEPQSAPAYPGLQTRLLSSSQPSPMPVTETEAHRLAAQPPAFEPENSDEWCPVSPLSPKTKAQVKQCVLDMKTAGGFPGLATHDAMMSLLVFPGDRLRQGILRLRYEDHAFSPAYKKALAEARLQARIQAQKAKQNHNELLSRQQDEANSQQLDPLSLEQDHDASPVSQNEH